MSADQTIREILERFDERPGEGVTWKVQGTPVLHHKALERIAAKARITFDVPTVIRAERDEAVMMVVGHMPATEQGEARTEWSVGECLVNVNYRVSGKQAAYVYAMAEKRAKDRVILKLIGLHGLAYSEEEADDFKASNPDKQQFESARDRFVETCRQHIASASDAKVLLTWWSSAEQKQQRRDFELTQAQADALKQSVIDRQQTIQSRAAA
jgi:hypothetical protein